MSKPYCVGTYTLTEQHSGCLGRGIFGQVLKCTAKNTIGMYALKVVICPNVNDTSYCRIAVEKAKRLSTISHENLVAVEAASERIDTPFELSLLILTEYCAGGNLNERLHHPSSDLINYKWFRQITAGLSFLHSNGVIHGDLKLQNVLLTATDDVKLSDFGMAQEYTALKRAKARIDNSSWMKSFVDYYTMRKEGPIYWVAPEFFSFEYTEKSDVFSLGAALFAILERDFITIIGRKVYGAFKNIPCGGKVGLGYAMAMYVPEISIAFSRRAQGSKALQRIVLDALQYNKDERPSVAEIHDRVVSVRPRVGQQSRYRQRQEEGRQQSSSESATSGCCYPIRSAWFSRSKIMPAKEVSEMHFKSTEARYIFK